MQNEKFAFVPRAEYWASQGIILELIVRGLWKEQCLCFFLLSLGSSSCAWRLNPSWFYFSLVTLPLPFDVCMIQISEPYVIWLLVEIKFRKNREVTAPSPIMSIWPPESECSLFFSSIQMRCSSSIYQYWNPSLKL